MLKMKINWKFWKWRPKLHYRCGLCYKYDLEENLFFSNKFKCNYHIACIDTLHMEVY
jgi:hypothetical protein